MEGVKNLYRGAFNLNRVMLIEYAYAHSQIQAWAIMCRRIAKRDGVRPGVVTSLFDGSKDNYKIEIEMEMKEI